MGHLLAPKDLQLEMAGIASEQKVHRWMLGAGIFGILSWVLKVFLIPIIAGAI